MDEFGKRGKNSDLKATIGLENLGNVFWNLTPAELVEDTIIVELKAVQELLPVHSAQLISYMKLIKKTTGPPIQFLFG